MSTRTRPRPGIGRRFRRGEQDDRAVVGTVVLLLVLFAPLAAWVTSGQSLPFDQAFHQRVAQACNRTLTHLTSVAIGLASASVIVGPVMVLSLFATYQRRRAAIVAASGLGALALSLVLKDLFHRTRPGEAAPDYLFPSTHMVLTVVVYGMLAGLIGMRARGPLRWLIICVAACLVGCVGLSLVYFDLHYLTDVIGGLLVGGAWLCVSLVLLGHAAPKSRWPTMATAENDRRSYHRRPTIGRDEQG
ncbi:MAG: phosphatase PAP2 family protein [Chloroflexota bacterium]|nr:phosphatase PAP2 family protein [Chloroflexota bacterium]